MCKCAPNRFRVMHVRTRSLLGANRPLFRKPGQICSYRFLVNDVFARAGSLLLANGSSKVEIPSTSNETRDISLYVYNDESLAPILRSSVTSMYFLSVRRSILHFRVLEPEGDSRERLRKNSNRIPKIPLKPVTFLLDEKRTTTKRP